MKVTITHFEQLVQELPTVKRQIEPAHGEAEPVYVEETPEPKHLGWSVFCNITASWGATSTSFVLELPAYATVDDFEKAVLEKYGK